MKFYRIATCDHINDLSGQGAYLHGGRWNSKGVHMLYTAESSALSMLEALAHITMANVQRAYCRVVLELKEETTMVGGTRTMAEVDSWFREMTIEQLPADWRSCPGPDALKAIGDAFVSDGNYLVLKVPSVVDPENFNYLLNPKNAAFTKIEVIKTEPVSFDQRLLAPRGQITI